MIEKKHFSQLDSIKNSISFGLTPNGEEVFCSTLSNKNGMELSVMNYGATITSVKVPVSNTKKIDVVLGFNHLSDYIDSFKLPSPPYLGAVIGRFAGRINQGKFSLNNQTIQLNQNHNSNHLHGGNIGFSQKIWKIINTTEGKNPSITLFYSSPEKEENYPGNLAVEVTYTLTENNQITVEFKAKSSEDTVVNLTQHSYFNLDGENQSIQNQLLTINSTKIVEVDSDNIPTGLLLNVANCPFDFTEQKKCPTSIDNTFVLSEKNKIAASLYSENSKLKMNVYTNQPAVHIYVGGNCFGQIKGKNESDYHSLSGICFETQTFPDAPNHSHFPSAFLKKDELYYHKTTFEFENILN